MGISSERQRTTANDNERQRTSANLSELQRTSANFSESSGLHLTARNNIICKCYMLADRTVQFADEVLHLIDDFVPGVKTKIIAEQLVRSATSTAANYAAAQRARSMAEHSSQECTVHEEVEESACYVE